MKKHENEKNHEETDETVGETIGVVVNCQRLNIRKEPSVNSAVIGVAEVLEELQVDTYSSDDEWLAVCTSDGIEGFCMKMFIKLRR